MKSLDKKFRCFDFWIELSVGWEVIRWSQAIPERLPSQSESSVLYGSSAWSWDMNIPWISGVQINGIRRCLASKCCRRGNYLFELGAVWNLAPREGGQLRVWYIGAVWRFSRKTFSADCKVKTWLLGRPRYSWQQRHEFGCRHRKQRWIICLRG